MSRKASRHIKIEKETIERLEEIPEQIKEKTKALDRVMNSFHEKMTVAYKDDTAKNCKKNMERGRMLLIEYIDQMNKRTKLEQGEESPVKREKNLVAEEQKPVRMEDRSRKEIKDEDKAIPAEEDIPDIIKPKKTGYRKARPGELLFSAHGTPLSIEQPRSLMKNLQSVLEANPKEQLDYDNPLGNDISEVD